MVSSFRLTLLLLIAVLPAVSLAEPYQIRGTHTHPVSSSVNQLKYELYVSLPRSYTKGNAKYPVVVLQDTDFAFPIATGVAGLLMGKDMEEVILVGISYSIGDSAALSRTRDYTPTFAPNETHYHTEEAKKGSGKAKDYLAFIEKDVFPFLQENYRIDMDNTVFVGHSFGGLLGAYTLLVNPTLFDHYILGSPSLWYDNRVVFELEKTYATTHKAMPANVLAFIGEREDGNFHPMVTELRQFEAQVRSRNYEGLSFSVNVLPEGTHRSSFPLLLTKALPMLFPKRKS